MNKNTIYNKNIIMSKSSVGEVAEYIRTQEDCFISWQAYIKKLVVMMGNSYEKFGRKTGFSKNTVKKWCETGIMPQNREAFIKLAFGLGMKIDETNTLLSKYGQYSELYAKDLHDAITIYILNKHNQDISDEKYSFDSLSEWFEKFDKLIAERHIDDQYYFRKKTIGIYSDIQQIRADSDFEKYILDNKELFLSTYSALVKFIDDFISIRINEQNDRFDKNDRISWHSFAKEKGIDSSFEKMLSSLRTQGILPKRKQLIALGIHLNMVASDINHMLSLANMKELYARDKTEALLMYILRNAEKYDPDLVYNNAFSFSSITNDRRLAGEYRKVISDFLENAPDTDDYDDCDRIESIAKYIKDQLDGVTPEEFIENLF